MFVVYTGFTKGVWSRYKILPEQNGLILCTVCGGDYTCHHFDSEVQNPRNKRVSYCRFTWTTNTLQCSHAVDSYPLDTEKS